MSAASTGTAASSAGSPGGGWTAPQFRRWLAAYLRELRLSPDPAHRDLVLRSARPLLEADPSLGLSVFLGQDRRGGASTGWLAQRHTAGGKNSKFSKTSGARSGGRLAPHDVVSFLKTIVPSEVSLDLMSLEHVIWLAG